MLPTPHSMTAFRKSFAITRNTALLGLSALALLACADSSPASIEMALPESLSTAFPADDVPFSNVERSRLKRATRHVFDHYGEELPDHSEYEAMLRTGERLEDLAPAVEEALGGGWTREREMPTLREAEIISFVGSDSDGSSNARVIFVSVPSEGREALFQPTRIISSVPIEGLK